MKRIFLFMLRRQARRIKAQRKELRLLYRRLGDMRRQRDRAHACISNFRDGARRILSTTEPV